METISDINERLKAAKEEEERAYDSLVAKLDERESDIKVRSELIEKMSKHNYANLDAADGDLLEVNAGGTIVAARRSTLTQLKGTKFEALFSGRWDQKLQKDSNERIFLDVNPFAFRAIVNFLTELAISSEDDPPSPPYVKDEHEHALGQQLELFGLLGQVPAVEMDSMIVKEDSQATQLHDWLKEGDSNEELELLYRGSRDGLTSDSFHSRCANKGCTLTVIETTDGYVLGGYSNTPWSSSRRYKRADRAFLFVLAGSDVASPSKMQLNDEQDDCAVYHAFAFGPHFGNRRGLEVRGSKVSVESSGTYEPWPAGQLSKNDASFTIKEIEVFRVSNTSGETALVLAKGLADATRELPQAEPVTRFSKEINEALNAKQDYLLQSEFEVLRRESVFEGERNFIEAFAGSDANDAVALNVCGTMMATHRATLQIVEDSVLARQFDDSKWTEQGIGPRVKEWTPDDVSSWAGNIAGIPASVGDTLKENGITGPELLALNMEGLQLIGIERAGTMCLLLEKIEGLKKTTEDVVTLIEHSPYCFGKIVDFLRLKRLHTLGLAENPSPPEVCDEQRSSFEKIARFYFPGGSANVLLGEAASAPARAGKRRKTSKKTRGQRSKRSALLVDLMDTESD